MIDDAAFGKRSKRGDWTPFRRIEYPPVFVWPAQPIRFLQWCMGDYLWSWQLVYAVVAILVWLLLTPSLEVTRTLGAGWIAFLLVRNAALILIFFGAWHLRLYIQRKQGKTFKFNSRWPPTGSRSFLFRKQTIDNMIWTFASGVPIWTALEMLMLWSCANAYVPLANWTQNPVYCVLLLLAVPLIRDVHFYMIHRLLHWPPLYHLAHKVHHYNVNPGPWSGLSMHPVEHCLYFSGVLIHFLVPAHPVHILSQLVHAALSPAAGHSGFDKVIIDETGTARVIDTHSYAHYLHHKYFECNYADGVVPLDKWFGSFHDGSPEAQARVTTCRLARQRRTERQSKSL